jgi:Transcriptional regulatory protein, C terminal
MPLDVLLVTDAADFESALPRLRSFAHTLRHEPLSGDSETLHHGADVAIIDGRTDLSAARKACRRLTADAPAVAVVAVVAPADFVEVDVDWHFDDVLLAVAGAGYDCNGRARTVDVHVRRLRAKLGVEHESVVETVRGVGYMAVTPPQPRWIVSEPMLNPVWAPTASKTTSDSIAR